MQADSRRLGTCFSGLAGVPVRLAVSGAFPPVGGGRSHKCGVWLAWVFVAGPLGRVCRCVCCWMWWLWLRCCQVTGLENCLGSNR